MILKDFFVLLDTHLLGESATGRIVRFLRHMAALQLLGMERHSASLRLALHRTNRTLHPVQLPDSGLREPL